jgi:hypothetical protein
MPFVLALFADSWMADRLQLMNHAFVLGLTQIIIADTV